MAGYDAVLAVLLFPIRAHVNVKIITIPMDVNINIIRKGYLCLNDYHTKTIDKRKLH